MQPSPHPIAIMGAMGAAVLSGVALWFGTGLHPAWWLTWLAIVPVLLVAARSSARIAFFVAGAAWLAGGLNVVRLYAAILPVILVAILVALPAGVFACTVLLWRNLVRRGASMMATLALPAAWVTYEFLQALLSPHATAGNSNGPTNRFPPLKSVESWILRPARGSAHSSTAACPTLATNN